VVFNDGSIKLELLTTVPLHGNSRGENIFQSFDASLLQMNIPIHKLLSVTADSAPVVTNESVGLTGLYKKVPVFPEVFSRPMYLLSATL
jgi:hypothetical protein